MRRALLALAAVSLAAPAATGGAAPAQGRPAIAVRAALQPRIVLFGDTITARVEVTLDPRRVDPGSVRVAAGFAPWELVGKPERKRRDAPAVAYLRTSFTLRCVRGACVPPRETAPLQFPPGRVTYAERGARRRRSLRAVWPVLVVHTRIISSDFQRPDALASPWTADLVSLPAASYRLAPGIVLVLAATGGGISAAAGLALAYLAWPRRRPPLAPQPQPQAGLGPLQRALALLQDPARPNGPAGRRRALELVAEELAARGESGLAEAARALAWSQQEPPVEEASRLAARARAALDGEGEERGPAA